MKINVPEAKSNLKEEISKTKHSLLLWGIGIFIPTIITIVIYHLTVLQTFKTEVKETIDHAITKHKLDDLENRQKANHKTQ